MHSKTFQSPIAPQRVVLKPNWNCERQDTTSSDARTPFEHSDEHGGMFRETCRGEIDLRIQRLPHSTVQEHDHIRKQAVQKLIHQFENHANKEAIKENLQQKSAFNPFSEKLKDMVYIMGNMEDFKICEIFPNIQSPNCMTCLRTCVVFCTCRTCLRPSDKVRKFNSDRHDVLSIPHYVIKKGIIPWKAPREYGKTEKKTFMPNSFLIRRRRRGTNQSIQERFLRCLFIDNHK